MDAKKQTITSIVAQIAEAFTLEEGTDLAPLEQLAENIYITVNASLPAAAAAPKAVAAVKAAPAKKAASKTSSGEKRKGNSYSHFVSVVAAQARGEGDHSEKLISVAKRSEISPASAKNIGEHLDHIEYGAKLSFAQFYDLVNGFETQPMRRAGVMWNLLSDEDRKQFALEE
jgi:hypothetical protein